MFRRFPLYTLLPAILLGGCSTIPEPNDPFAPQSNEVAPPQIYGGEPLSRSEFQNLTAAPPPEMPASYQQTIPPQAAHATSVEPDAYQGRPLQAPASIPDAAKQADFESVPDAALGTTAEAPQPELDRAPSVAEKPEVPLSSDSDSFDDTQTVAEDPKPYGHGNNYGWLRGKLEYSHVERAWKLRYAPIDIEDDPHGGGVFLGNDSRLRNFREGDVVYVEGRPLDGSTGVFSPGPRYEIDRITLLEKP